MVINNLNRTQKKSAAPWAGRSPVSCLNYISVILLLLWFTVFSGLYLVSASASEASSSSSDKLSKEDEELIDKFLDETLGIDPAKAEKELARPSSASGFSVYTGYGYEKNVLSSDWLNLSSRKSYTIADYFYARKKNRVNQLNFYAYLDNSHYPDLEVESDKHEFFSRAQGKWWITETNALGISLSYFYQITFDVDAAVEFEPIPEYKNEEFIVAPLWEKDLGNNLFFVTELEFLSKRTLVPADDFERYKLIALLKKKYAQGSEIRITLDTGSSAYDQGEILDLDGFTIEDTKLRIDSYSLGFFNNHYWSGDKNINLKSYLFLQTQIDNGPGYYNYNYYYLGETFQFRLANWQFSSTLRLNYYQYAERKRTTAEDDAEKLINSLIEVDAKVERNFGDDLSVKIETVGLQSASNDLTKEYTSDSFLVGVLWFF